MAFKHTLCLVGIGLLTTHHTAYAGTLYTIETLGFYDTLHTRDDGYQFNRAEQLNQAGQVSGEAKRYNGGSTDLGQSAWLYNGSRTRNIGLTGNEHTREDGYQNNRAEQLNEAGQVSGTATRYNGGSTYLGQSVWLYNGRHTRNIGLTDSEHTREDDYQFSFETGLNEAGQVIGNAHRWNGGSTELGRSAWLYGGGRTRNIGLTDSEHTRDDGYRFSSATTLNQAGQVLVYADRYNGGSTGLGTSAWLYDGGSMRNIGLTGNEHTRDDGYQMSIPLELNEAGLVGGVAERYNGGSTYLGQSAWLYNGSRTLTIGLTGSEHTRDDGYQSNSVHQLNEAGQVLGQAKRYNGGSTDLGQSVWLYNGSRTRNIGLTDSEHTRDDGYQVSVWRNLNQAGQVLGQARRYNGGSTDLGQSAWLYNGSRTRNIGLTGNEHTRDDGYQNNRAEQLNEAGHVSGTATRYNDCLLYTSDAADELT